MSNIVNFDYTPKILQRTPLFRDREAFWQKLRVEGISLTRFYVFAHITELRAHLAARHIYSVEIEEE